VVEHVVCDDRVERLARKGKLRHIGDAVRGAITEPGARLVDHAFGEVRQDQFPARRDVSAVRNPEVGVAAADVENRGLRGKVELVENPLGQPPRIGRKALVNLDASLEVACVSVLPLEKERAVRAEVTHSVRP
jgi:hypothetical protein